MSYLDNVEFLDEDEDYEIDGIEYTCMQNVIFKGEKYAELQGTDMSCPTVEYFKLNEKEIKFVEDYETFLSLRILSGADVLSLFGVLILDGPHLSLDEDEFGFQDGKFVIYDPEKKKLFDSYVKK